MPDEPKPPLEVWLPLPLTFGTPAPLAPPAPPAPEIAPTDPVVAKAEVGDEIEAYCPSPRCTSDQTHTIISLYEDEIRRVQCTSCGEVHAYRPPRGAAAEPAGPAPSWDDAMSGKDPSSASPYSIRTTYVVGDLVHHPVFEIGVVVAVLPDNKVEVVFRERSSILVHAR